MDVQYIHLNDKEYFLQVMVSIIFQDYFDSILTSMMGALAEIQRKGDTMLAGIKRQREVLDNLERQAEQADRRREQSENLARQMEDEMQNLVCLKCLYVFLIMSFSVQSEIWPCSPPVPGFREKIRTDQF